VIFSVKTCFVEVVNVWVGSSFCIHSDLNVPVEMEIFVVATFFVAFDL